MKRAQGPQRARREQDYDFSPSFNSELKSDVCFVWEDGPKLYAHQVVLQHMRDCDVFHKMFSHPTTDSQQVNARQEDFAILQLEDRNGSKILQLADVSSVF